MGRSGWGFKDKNDAIALERLAKRERSKPNKTETVEFPQRLQNTLRAIVAVPLDEIPAATFVSGKIVLGKGDAYIFNRDQNDPDNLIQHLDENGDGVIEVIYNLCDQAFTPTGSGSGTTPDLGDAVFCTQDLDGDYYITLRCDQFDGSGGGSGSGSGSGGAGGTIQELPNLRIRATDEGVVIGATRGDHSTDLQTKRNYNYQVASGPYSVITGGLANEASNSHAGVFSGLQNKARGVYSGVGWGRGNYVSGGVALILNGYYNSSTNTHATIINGRYSTASGYISLIGNGKSNTAVYNYSTIMNGKYNYNRSAFGFIGNGNGNYMGYSIGNVITSGANNRITNYSNYNFIGTGYNHTITSSNNFIGTGVGHYISGSQSFISTGRSNSISGRYSTILCGRYSSTYGDYTLAVGRYASVGGFSAMQLGPGYNPEAYTIRIGSAGLRLKMTTGAPGGVTDGDIWVSGGTVYIRSAGVSVAI